MGGAKRHLGAWPSVHKVKHKKSCKPSSNKTNVNKKGWNYKKCYDHHKNAAITKNAKVIIKILQWQENGAKQGNASNSKTNSKLSPQSRSAPDH